MLEPYKIGQLSEADAERARDLDDPENVRPHRADDLRPRPASAAISRAAWRHFRHDLEVLSRLQRLLRRCQPNLEHSAGCRDRLHIAALGLRPHGTAHAAICDRRSRRHGDGVLAASVGLRLGRLRAACAIRQPYKPPRSCRRRWQSVSSVVMLGSPALIICQRHSFVVCGLAAASKAGVCVALVNEI